MQSYKTLSVFEFGAGVMDGEVKRMQDDSWLLTWQMMLAWVVWRAGLQYFHQEGTQQRLLLQHPWPAPACSSAQAPRPDCQS